jgi:thioredoxin reductase (NADPH)
MFPKLTSAQLLRLQPHSARHATKAGEILLEAGDEPRGVFIVERGSVEVLVPTSDVRSETCDYALLNVLTAGDFSGEMNSLRGAAGLVRLRVREPGSVLQMSLEDLRRVVQNDAELSELFMRAFILRRMGVLESGHSEVTLLGSSRSGDTLRIREFLTRNARPYVNIDVDRDAGARALLKRFHVGHEELPVVICRRGELLENPDNRRLAECVGINAPRNDEAVHDFVVIGAGPAGLAAAVYATSEGADTCVVDTFAPGGQAGTSSLIENYLGFPTGISGGALAGRALSQAQKFGAQINMAWHAVRLHRDQWPYAVEMSSGRLVRGRTVLIASGAEYRVLDLAELPRFLGSGVYYAATHLVAKLCDGEDGVVVGGGNSAGQAAVFLSSYCSHVHILVRGPGLAESMSNYLIRRINGAPNISLHTRTQIMALEGAEHLERVTWTAAGGAPEERNIRHVFLMLGALPNTRWLQGCVALDERGFVKTGPDLSPQDLKGWTLPRAPYLLETSVAGVFAAGDARSGSTKRIAAAVGEGSASVQFVHRALRELAEAQHASAVAAT